MTFIAVGPNLPIAGIAYEDPYALLRIYGKDWSHGFDLASQAT